MSRDVFVDELGSLKGEMHEKGGGKLRSADDKAAALSIGPGEWMSLPPSLSAEQRAATRIHSQPAMQSAAGGSGERAARAREAAEYHQREEVLSRHWKIFLHHLDPRRATSDSEKLARTIVRERMPISVRPFYWMRVTGALTMLHKNRGVYEYLLGRYSGHLDAISKDVARTLPHQTFSGLSRRKQIERQSALMNVLRAYSSMDASTGYVQGMSFIAMLILEHLGEEHAFWMFCSLCKTYNLGALFEQGLGMLRRCLYILDRLIETRLPRLFSHFKELSITPLLYASEWFSTLFVYSLPLETVSCVWDVFLLEGVEFLYRVALAILLLRQPILLKKGFEFIIVDLKSCASFVKLEDLIITADSLHIDPSELQRYEDEFNDPRASDDARFL